MSHTLVKAQAALASFLDFKAKVKDILFKFLANFPKFWVLLHLHVIVDMFGSIPTCRDMFGLIGTHLEVLLDSQLVSQK